MVSFAALYSGCVSAKALVANRPAVMDAISVRAIFMGQSLVMFGKAQAPQRLRTDK
jgi:hypothetical protein